MSIRAHKKGRVRISERISGPYDLTEEAQTVYSIYPKHLFPKTKFKMRSKAKLNYLNKNCRVETISWCGAANFYRSKRKSVIQLSYVFSKNSGPLIISGQKKFDAIWGIRIFRQFNFARRTANWIPLIWPFLSFAKRTKNISLATKMWIYQNLTIQKLSSFLC